MGNQPSSQHSGSYFGDTSKSSHGTPVPVAAKDDKEKYRSFPGSALLEKTFCGSIDTTDPSEYQDQSIATRLMHKADVMCIRSPRNYDASSPANQWVDDEDDILLEHKGKKPSVSSALLARALVSEVTDNPKTMTPVEMAARERKLLKAQQAARNGPAVHKPVGTKGTGVGPPNVLSSVAYALTGEEHMLCAGNSQVVDDIVATGALHDALGENGGRSGGGECSHLALEEVLHQQSPYVVTIALCLSRHYEDVGHPESVTRQTAFDFNEVQDRDYKYVSSTDAMGWRAGGGERGGPVKTTGTSNLSPAQPEPGAIKKAHRDDLHLPIIHLDCGSAEAVDHVIHTLASGDIFIPHMAVLPDSLAVHGSPLPDLMLRWQCERNEDVPVDEWQNWCLEFIHNQIFEYFHQTSVRPIWMPRPFNVTLAKAVRWRTVKHMNRYFSLSEQVLERWREAGPQYLDPQHSHSSGGASPDELARPHGIYLWRKVGGVIQPTNYFAPNFDPPYTTKMTRCLLETVLSKSWDTQRREWSSHPLPVILSPAGLLQAACGCTEVGGFVAQEVTNKAPSMTPASLSSQQQAQKTRHSPRRQDQTKGTHKPEIIVDEKKVEDIVRPEETVSNSRKYIARQSLSSMNNEAGVSGNFSVAASGTTVMHRNRSLHEQEDKEKRLFSDDDWRASSTLVADPPGDKVMASPQGYLSFQSEFESEKRKNKNLRVQADNETKAPTKPSQHYKMQPSPPGQNYQSVVTPKVVDSSDSYSSLAYSVGNSSGYTGFASGYTSNIGQHYADTPTAYKSAAAGVTKSISTEEDFSIQESSSSLSVIPTDEELYSIGWAKALDPNSGNFYYFTLDRKKIMWENPLPRISVKGTTRGV